LTRTPSTSADSGPCAFCRIAFSTSSAIIAGAGTGPAASGWGPRRVVLRRGAPYEARQHFDFAQRPEPAEGPAKALPRHVPAEPGANQPLTRGTACRPATRSIGNAMRSPRVKGQSRGPKKKASRSRGSTKPVFYGIAPGISRRVARPGCLILLSYANMLPQSVRCTSQGPFRGPLSIYGKNLLQGCPRACPRVLSDPATTRYRICRCTRRTRAGPSNVGVPGSRSPACAGRSSR